MEEFTRKKGFLAGDVQIWKFLMGGTPEEDTMVLVRPSGMVWYRTEDYKQLKPTVQQKKRNFE